LCCQVERSLRQDDHSFRGVLPSVVCLSVVRLSVVRLSVVRLSVVRLSVIMTPQ